MVLKDQMKGTFESKTVQQDCFHIAKTFNKSKGTIHSGRILVSLGANIHFTAMTLTVLFWLFSLSIFPENLSASSNNNLELNKKYSATLEKCVDGDTAHFNINGKVYKTRFLYIDTPESTNKIEPFGNVAAEFSCTMLREGNIILETDGDELYDKYDRLLAWVWVDDKLLQEEITRAGWVKGFYDYGNYRYEEPIHAAMEEAKTAKRGIYGDGESETNINNFIVVVALIIIVVSGIVIAFKRNKK